MENAPKKGMSKGCLILLIVGSAIVILAILGALTCWYFKDDLAKMGSSTLVNGLKTELGTSDFEDVDTVQFNAMADAFMAKMNAEDPLDWDRYALFMGAIQNVMEDKSFGADEVPIIEDAFIMYYPDLEIMLPAPPEEPVFEEDSLGNE